MIRLSRTDRLILTNQYRMMLALGIVEDKKVQYACEILESGYEGEYGSLFREIDSDTVDDADCRFVHDILVMARNIVEDYGDEIEHLPYLRQVGFDANHDSKLLRYARFVVRNSGSYSEQISVVDSHMPTRDIYHRMLTAFGESASRNRPSKEDVERIIAAAELANG